MTLSDLLRFFKKYTETETGIKCDKHNAQVSLDRCGASLSKDGSYVNIDGDTIGLHAGKGIVNISKWFTISAGSICFNIANRAGRLSARWLPNEAGKTDFKPVVLTAGNLSDLHVIKSDGSKVPLSSILAERNLFDIPRKSKTSLITQAIQKAVEKNA